MKYILTRILSRAIKKFHDIPLIDFTLEQARPFFGMTGDFFEVSTPNVQFTPVKIIYIVAPWSRQNLDRNLSRSTFKQRGVVFYFPGCYIPKCRWSQKKGRKEVNLRVFFFLVT